tara:strand:+ start:1249 stop:1428 length:180 start_codon:yes stop_codon:yes gene_type:complete
MILCDELEQQVMNNQPQIEQLMQSCLSEVYIPGETSRFTYNTGRNINPKNLDKKNASLE